MHMDPVMPNLVGTVAAILLLGFALRALRQPQLIAYLLAGVVLGPSGVGLVSDHSTISRLGEIGVVLLLFFVGMEISLPEFVARWKVPVLGTLLQISLSVLCVVGVGTWQGWPAERSVLLGFVVSLSSTAVVIKLLREKGETESPVGRDVIGILLMQDLAIVPMLIIIGLLSETPSTGGMIVKQVVGGAIAIISLAYIATRRELHLPLGRWLRGDRELQIFASGAICFGLAYLSGLSGLSAALGAFLGGILVGAAKETRWIHESLFPFHILLLALFFMSVGMLIDLHFVWSHWAMILTLLLAVLLTNTILNTVILRVLGRSWNNSIYGGATLAQIGEFSFVLAAVGRKADLFEDFAYQTTSAVIALSMLISPLWISGGAKLGRYFSESAARARLEK